MKSHEGQCRCGTIKFRFIGEPLTTYLCHCTKCQRRTGSAFGMTMHIPTLGYEVLSGSPKEIHSDFALMLVCPNCLSWVITHTNKILASAMPPGLFNDTSWFKPVANIWTRSAQPWVKIDENLRNYEKQPKQWTELYPSDFLTQTADEI